MQKFCQECGAEAAADQKFCLSCGRPLHQEEQVIQPAPPPPAPKRKRTKKEKTIIASSLTILILLIGGIYGTSLYFSADQTAERFSQAFKEGDAATIQKLVLHEDGSNISEFEAEALLALDRDIVLRSLSVTSDTQLFTLTEQKPLLGIIKKYAVTGINQYIELPLPDESVQAEVKLNDKALSTPAEGGNLTAGPLTPGIYTMTTEFSNEFGKMSDEQELELVDLTRDVQTLGSRVEFADVSFNLQKGSPAQTKLNIDGNEITFNDNGRTDTIGPIPIGSSLKAKATSTFPWGAFSSEETEILAGENSIEVPVLSEEQSDQLLDEYLQYSEDLLKAMATFDSDHFTNVSPDHQKELNEQITSLKENQFIYSGLLAVAVIYPEEAKAVGEPDSLMLSMPAAMMTQSSYDDISLDPVNYTCDLVLEYSNDSFKIHGCDLERSDAWHLPPTSYETAGSETYYETVVETNTVTAESSTDLNFHDGLEEEVEAFMRNYNSLSVKAINEQDFSIIAPYTTGSRASEQRDYIDYLASEGITEEHDHTNLISIDVVSEDRAIVLTEEWFYIFAPEGEPRYTGFHTESMVILEDGQFMIEELLHTDPITID
ncbi:zinc ribbon domain-containing protein [Jeotgalibacillus haloalkalitolerans]|uniref:Zinc-ribbon domain-containing protein n=1 Tax=Jeotgalibacillus haloalkalitolerans TaxID=3104292 RepID=A0ABU5KJK9_9BACL|nr:zinc-ribbon domain-containing protein [Jeotgalibacillus sp. HH7-29]MDZ5711408.1 hypothetical protein [Jeotgalibacillus sp. HH7-29]